MPKDTSGLIPIQGWQMPAVNWCQTPLGRGGSPLPPTSIPLCHGLQAAACFAHSEAFRNYICDPGARQACAQRTLLWGVAQHRAGMELATQQDELVRGVFAITLDAARANGNGNLPVVHLAGLAEVRGPVVALQWIISTANIRVG